MKQLISLIFLLLFFSTCKEKSVDLHGIVNAYIKEKNTKNEPPLIVVIFEKTIPLKTAMEIPEPPGSLYLEEIESPNFEGFLEKNILSKEEIEFMKAQLHPTEKPYNELPFYFLDSARISLPIMTELEYKEIFSISKNSYDCWDTYYSKYKGCYISFSNPLFNKEKSKVYFQTSQMCGRLYGHGEIVVMEKSKNGWEIIYRAETWES